MQAGDCQSRDARNYLSGETWPLSARNSIKYPMVAEGIKAFTEKDCSDFEPQLNWFYFFSNFYSSCSVFLLKRLLDRCCDEFWSQPSDWNLDEKTSSNFIIYSHYTAKYSFIYKDCATISDCVNSCTIGLNRLFLHEKLISTQHKKTNKCTLRKTNNCTA